MGLVSTFIGQSVVDRLVKRYKQDGIIVLVIAAIMVIALILMTVAGVQKAMTAAPGFHPMCDAKK